MLINSKENLSTYKTCPHGLILVLYVENVFWSQECRYIEAFTVADKLLASLLHSYISKLNFSVPIWRIKFKDLATLFRMVRKHGQLVVEALEQIFTAQCSLESTFLKIDYKW